MTVRSPARIFPIPFAWVMLICAWAVVPGLRPLLAQQPAPPSGQVQEHLKKGHALLDDEDWDGALKEYREAVRQAPDNADAHVGVGRALGWKYDRKGAKVEMQEALRLDPNSAVAHNGMGWILDRYGDSEGALKEFREAIRLKPDYARPHSNIGWVLNDKNDLDGALRECREAVRLKPNETFSHEALAWILNRRGDFDAAIHEYQQTIQLKPGDNRAHEGLAWVLDVKGDWKGALAEFHQAIRVKPHSPDPHIWLGLAFFYRPDLDGALTEFREAVRVKPDSPVAHTDVGWALGSKGDHEGAIAEYQKAIDLIPDYGEAHSRLATEFRRMGDWRRAGQEAAYAVTFQPDLATPHFELGLALEHQGDRKGAFLHYQKAAQLDPDSPAAISYRRMQSEFKYLPANWSPSMVYAFSVAAALVPSFLLLIYFRGRDLYPEPAWALWGTFLLGAAIIYPVLLIDKPLGLLVQPFHSPLGRGLAEAFFNAALPEELMKFAVVMLFCVRLKAFNEPMDGIVYGAVASLGFAAFENVKYVTGYGIGCAFVRAVASVPGHAFMGAMMGYFVGQWRFGPPAGRGWALVKAYLVPVTLHWGYDFPLIASETASGLTGPARVSALTIYYPLIILSVAVLAIESIWAVRLVNRTRKEQIQIARDAVAAAAAAEGAMDIVALVNAPDAPPSAWPGWLMGCIGGLVATWGGFLSLLVVIIITEHIQRGDFNFDVFNGALIGGIPLLVGLVLFVYGVRRIHASRRRLPPLPIPAVAVA